ERRDVRREPAHEGRHLRRCHESRRVLDEDEAERVGAGVHRDHRVVEIGDAADLHLGHRRVRSRTLPPTPRPSTSPSPTSTARAPAATTWRTWSPVKKPLSLMTIGPGG